MAFMTDIDNVVTLGSTSLHFVMHFRDERAHRVNHITAT